MRKSSQLNYELLCQDLLKTIRGHHSQNWMTKRLNAKGNLYFRYETGITAIPWIQFVTICEILKLDLNSTLRNILGYTKDLCDERSLWQHLTLMQNESILHKKLGITASHYKRISLGKSHLDLIMVLKTIDFSFKCLFNFLEQLVDITLLESEQERVQYFLDLRELILNKPISGAILSVLQLESYRDHKNPSLEFIAKILNSPIQEVNECIEGLVKYHVITLKSGRYIFEPDSNFLMLKGVTPSLLKPMITHWNKYTTQKLLEKPYPLGAGQFNSVQVLLCDEESEAKIKELTVDFYKKLQLILQERKSAKSIKILSINFIDTEF